MRDKIGADSRYFTVISPSGLEFVFFNAGQVLPCYIIRLRPTGTGDTKAPLHQLPPLLQKYQAEANNDDNAKKKQEKLLARVTHSSIVTLACIISNFRLISFYHMDLGQVHVQ